MAVKVDGKLFTGVTYNQGAYAGDRGHLFIMGMQQCSYALSLRARNRIWQKITTIAGLEKIVAEPNTCEKCSKNVTQVIQANKMEATK
jgi:bacterioferritin-associated ferredoxin